MIKKSYDGGNIDSEYQELVELEKQSKIDDDIWQKAIEDAYIELYMNEEDLDRLVWYWFYVRRSV